MNMDKNTDKKRLCVVGAGSIGRRHIRLLNERDDVSISIVEPFEKSYQRIVDEIGTFKRFSSMDEAIASGEVDAVVIATPHGMHSEMAIKALNAGLDVFCEKPMSDSLPDCVKMLNAVKTSGRVFQTGFMFRFDPIILKMKEIADSGRIGNIIYFSSRFCSYNILLCSVTRHQADHPYSLPMDTIHDTDLLYFFTGRIPDHVFASGFRAGDLEFSSDPNFLDVIYRYDKGDLGAAAHFDYAVHPQVHDITLVGDKGYIGGDLMSETVTVGSTDGSKEILSIHRDIDDIYRPEWQSFLEAVNGDHAPENPAESAIAATLLLQCQIDSAKSGREVSVAEAAEAAGFCFKTPEVLYN